MVYSPLLLKFRFCGIYIGYIISGNADHVSDFSDGVDGETIGIGYGKQVADASVNFKIDVHSKFSFVNVWVFFFPVTILYHICTKKTTTKWKQFGYIL
jgi:hypothetical protein